MGFVNRLQDDLPVNDLLQTLFPYHPPMRATIGSSLRQNRMPTSFWESETYFHV